jgi:glycosyltransferase involved in cell wall biosynthesis
VATRSGWFSDRSACYLASGKPVLAHDTGLASLFPIGEGLLVFSSPDEAVAGVEEICSNYELHSQSARRIAEDHFGSDVVLTRLLQELEIE